MFIEFITIFIVSLILINVVKYYAPKVGLVDIPNNRSTHNKHTPRSAGIGFYLAVSLIYPIFHFNIIEQYPWTFLAISFIFCVGVLDDQKDTSPNTKFIVLILSTLLLSFDRLLIDDVGTFFGQPITLSWLAFPFTIFAVTGFTNALNLIDGLDGLAASLSIVILSVFFIIGYQNDDNFMMSLSIAFIAALLAFLMFNWNPASIFMGDSGSLTLGFVISILSIKSLDYLPAVSILFIGAIPILDTVIVMARRKFKGRSMVAADRCHLHHIVKSFFMENTEKTVLFFVIVQVIYSIIGMQQDKTMDEGYLMTAFLLNVVVLYFIMGAMIKRQKCDC